MTDTEGYENSLAEVAKAISSCAMHLKYLGVGDAASTMGAVEFLAVSIKEGLERVAGSIDRLAGAVEGIEGTAAVVEKLDDIKDQIGYVATEIEEASKRE